MNPEVKTWVRRAREASASSVPSMTVKNLLTAMEILTQDEPMTESKEDRVKRVLALAIQEVLGTTANGTVTIDGDRDTVEITVDMLTNDNPERLVLPTREWHDALQKALEQCCI